VHGHVHPCLRLGRRLSTACYLTAPDRIVCRLLRRCRGVNVLRDRRWSAYCCYALTADRVLELGPVAESKAEGGRRKAVGNGRTAFCFCLLILTSSGSPPIVAGARFPYHQLPL